MRGVLLAALGIFWPAPAQDHAEPDAWPRRVLVTNDDGVSDARVWALAGAFSAITETWLIAPFDDKSGSSNFLSTGKYQRTLLVKRERGASNLEAYAVAGYPADCVTFGLNGVLKNRRPDLVIAGINGGPNLGQEGWFGSGTIGAARTAAFLGVPAIAVSGLDERDSEMVKAVSRFIVDLARSDFVRGLEPGDYLTVSVPRLRAADVRGVRVAARTPPLSDLRWRRVWAGAGEEREEVWLVEEAGMLGAIPPDTDAALYAEGWIVVVPHHVDEHDRDRLDRLARDPSALPPWRGP